MNARAAIAPGLTPGHARLTTTARLQSARGPTKEFAEVVAAMINRKIRGLWSFQEVINRTVIERLQRDTEAVQRFKDKPASNPTAREIASLPRYLAAAGALDNSIHERCRSLLQEEAHYALPRAGYDAVDDATQAVSRSPLEVLAPSFSP
jgi:hypothetical protein